MIWQPVTKTKNRSLTHQVFEQLTTKIRNGELRAGNKLPSTRDLAADLHISRNIVLEVYERLAAEGYLKIIAKSGTYVSDGAALEYLPEKISDYNMTMYSADKNENDQLHFYSGTPDLDQFPRKAWGRIANQVLLEAPSSVFGYDHAQGRPELRRVLCGYLRKTRGIRCVPEQIVVTSGTKQGLSILAKCLLSKESRLLIEDPTSISALKIFSYHTQHIYPIPVDQEGLRVDHLPLDIKPVCLFTTPSHQYPTGGILSIQRRIEIVNYARKTDCYILEDDYDSEFTYEHSPISSMQELDQEKVIYIGSFSKVLFPSLRLGYIVLPPPLIEPCRELKFLGDHHSNSLTQLTLLRFIEEGFLERHIAKMRKIYGNRRQTLIQCLNENFDDIKIFGGPAGLHLIAEFPHIAFNDEILGEIRKNGIGIASVEEHAIIKGLHTRQLVFGYAHLDDARIKEGVQKIRHAISTHV